MVSFVRLQAGIKASKKGKVKLTKADKARLQKEEEDRRLKEEEEARLQAERDEQERLEREKKDKVLPELELKDFARRENELDELRHLLEDNHNSVVTWKNEEAEKAKWESYMCCDGTPDPSVQQEINTYMSLWKEDPEVNVTKVLKQCIGALRLIEKLEDLLKETSNLLDIQKYQEAIANLQELIHLKHNLATEEILKEATANIDTQTGNMQTVVKDEHVTLCLWANLKKNPRFKGLNFEEVGLGFEIPKQLAVSNIAVRILHTRYDHLSLLARMTHTRMHTPSSRSLAGGENFLTEQGEINATREEVKTHDSEQQISVEEEDQSGSKSADGKSVSQTSLHSARISVHSAESGQSQIKTKIEGLNGSVDGDLSSSLSHLNTSETCFRVQVVDMMQYSPLGGVFYYNVFHLPPQAHHVNGWTIRQILDTGLEVFPYPQKGLQMNESLISKLDDVESIGSPPVGVSVTIPDNVMFLENPQVARWDATGKQWRMDGVTEVMYSEEESKISFKMDSFQPFVLIQDTYANFPFQSWELKPLGQDSALYTIKGALINVSITVQGHQCMLQTQEQKCLSHFTGKWMNSTALQRAMQDSGINIFVNEFTEKYVTTYGKDPLTEHSAYEQMALFSSACAFTWSRWNAQCGPEHLVMQVCEHFATGPVPKDRWCLYLLGAQRSQMLGISESSEAFSPDHCLGTEFHSTFIHMLQDHMSAEGIARTRTSDNLFVDTVQSLLCATRPLLYA
ncbi:dynein axonemal intermediate chain 7 [Periophthalmus magnuspinnatus]|uniref:dynein axonemal intermediate chain 7 n=1 Tax=Periophthalmus magnuspinnatus TaxID=409849 RepID=UPI00145A5182|nr:dynein axonemal intermediate chain 7 [Periophthalmus magnuspinnatus]